MKKIIIAGVAIAVAILTGFVFDWGMAPAIATFDECVAAGYPVMESFPPQCRTDDGQNFSQPLASRASKDALIVLDGVPDGSRIESPILLSGLARGQWFFEASFPIELIDENGGVIARTIAEAESDWMTSEFVPFSASLSFASTTHGDAKLVLRKDNPSGMPEFDDALVVPVVLGK